MIAMANPAPNVPLARPVILGSRGDDVIAVKRALSRAGFLKWTTFTQIAGEYMMNGVHDFQKKVGLAKAGYGPHTHYALCHTRKKGSTTEWCWDALSIEMEHEVYVILHTSPETRIRQAILQAARNLYAHRYSIHYSQSRPFQRYTMGGPVPIRLDCSGFVTDCYDAAHAKNPNVEGGIGRLPYNGEGYTGTLMAGGQRTTRDALKLGDLVFYGFSEHSTPAFPYGSPTHVALYAGDNRVFSNGHYPMGFYPTYYGQYINCYVTYNVVP